MLEVIKAQCYRLVRWDLSCSRVSVFWRVLQEYPNAASIGWFHEHFSASFSVDMCRAAVGHPRLLQVLRGLQPPCPWDSSVSQQALTQVRAQTLAWLLSQDPPCPMELDHARRCPLTVVESGHVATLQRIWPVGASPQEMFERAARGGHMDMLRLLLEREREKLHSSIQPAWLMTNTLRSSWGIRQSSLQPGMITWMLWSFCGLADGRSSCLWIYQLSRDGAWSSWPKLVMWSDFRTNTVPRNS